MASEAAKLMFHCAFEASISMSDTEIERRPYHRNCGCALHKLKSARSDVCSHHLSVSFPKKQDASGKLSFSATSKSSSPSSFCNSSLIRNRDSQFEDLSIR